MIIELTKNETDFLLVLLGNVPVLNELRSDDRAQINEIIQSIREKLERG